MMIRLPSWFKQEIKDDSVSELSVLLKKSSINTVCLSAKCPNLNHCFKNKKFTFLILGDKCQRNCIFCNVPGNFSHPKPPDEEEPYRISELVKKLDLNYVVVTSVSRDDLSDGGACFFAQVIRLIHKIGPKIKVELLIPDFCGKITSLKKVTECFPYIIGHNIETVPRLYPVLRPKADYSLSLEILKKIKEFNPGIRTKSSLMLGMGEIEGEVKSAIKDLSSVGCDFLTLGQYLAPSKRHFPVKEFIDLVQFEKYKDFARGLNFKGVLSGPCVRSSYFAQELSEMEKINA